VVLGGKNYLEELSIYGFLHGGKYAAHLIPVKTAKLNGADPQAWLTDVLRRIASHAANRIAQLLLWNLKPAEQKAVPAIGVVAECLPSVNCEVFIVRFRSVIDSTNSRRSFKSSHQNEIAST
jgi:hypothetical protein